MLPCQEDSFKPGSKSPLSRRANRGAVRSHPVVMHYPAPMFADSASSSNSDLQLGSIRRTISTPFLQPSGDNVQNRQGLKRSPVTRTTSKAMGTKTTKGNEPPLKQSSSFIETNSELPIVDISALDYDAYRHKLIEAALRKKYDDYQPPGDVVLNSIHLNTNDSTVAVRLNDRYRHSFFDFVEEYYDPAKGISRNDAEYLRPLDHFLVKGSQKIETVEKETETGDMDAARESSGQDGKSLRISFYGDEGVKRRQHTGGLDSVTKKVSTASKPRSSSASREHPLNTSKCPRPAVEKSGTKFPKNTSNTDSVSSKRDTFSESPRLDNRQDTSSIDVAERESINCTTISSIDSESVPSESSKQPDDRSCHSRDSSVASKWRGSDVSERLYSQPRLSRNPPSPFARKQENRIPTLETQEPMKNSSLKNRGSTSSLQPRKQYLQSKAVVAENKNDQKHISLSGITHSNAVGMRRLEPIQSETESANTSIRANDSSVDRLSSNPPDRLNRTSAKVASKRTSRVQGSELASPFAGKASREAKFAPAQPNKVQTKNNDAGRSQFSKSSSDRSRPVKPAKRYRNKVQNSRTVTGNYSTFGGTAMLNPGAEVSELNENSPINSNASQSDQERDWMNERAAAFRNDNGKLPKHRQLKRNSNAKSGSGQRRRVPDLPKCQEETEHAAGKLPDDSNRKKQSSAAVANSASSAKDKSSMRSRSLEQKGKVNGRLRGNVKSMSNRSSKSSSPTRKTLATGKTERTDGSLDIEIDGKLKLPCRDSKAGLAMQVGLKKYIKKLKRVLSDRNNDGIGELASLSLTDAILPDIEATLSSVEVQQVQTVLNMAEKKSELM